MTAAARGVAVGAVLDLDVGPVAHGGHCVARHEGQVVFVRHALPGERVRAQVTSATSSFLRADATEILSPAPGRVAPPCHQAGPGGCGGCDWQHADLPTQRDLKASVVKDQLQRLAGVDRSVVVQSIGPEHGLGWRTRERFTVEPATGRAGVRRHRSHDVQVLDTCPLAADAVLGTGVLDRTWRGHESIQVIASASTSDVCVVVDDRPQGRRRVRERAAGRDWRVDAESFWQVHPAAADTLAAAVRAGAQARPGERVLDLYAGVGLFAATLAEDVGPAGRVDAVEGSSRAVRDARRNLHDLPVVRLHEAAVQEWLARPAEGYDVVVLDPPRAGAGAAVLGGVLARGPRVVVYVACDPAALARDVRTLAGHGWQLADLQAYDLFPMTHHVECVATFRPVAPAARA